jgi:hypothetical protein
MSDFGDTDIDPDDLLNLNNMRAAPNFDVGVEVVETGAALRKPRKQEFFQARHEEEFQLDTVLLEHAVEEEKSLYRVAPAVVAALRSLDVSMTLKVVRIFTCVNRRGSLFLWPQTLPGPEGSPGRSWHASALEVADASMRGWVAMEGNKAASCYRYARALGELPAPTWPDLSFQDLIRLAFKDRVITNGDHPVIKDLKGEA